MRLFLGIVFILLSIFFSYIWLLAGGFYLADVPAYGNPSATHMLLAKTIMLGGFIFFLIIFPILLGRIFFRKKDRKR